MSSPLGIWVVSANVGMTHGIFTRDDLSKGSVLGLLIHLYQASFYIFFCVSTVQGFSRQFFWRLSLKCLNIQGSAGGEPCKGEINWLPLLCKIASHPLGLEKLWKGFTNNYHKGVQSCYPGEINCYRWFASWLLTDQGSKLAANEFLDPVLLFMESWCLSWLSITTTLNM